MINPDELRKIITQLEGVSSHLDDIYVTLEGKGLRVPAKRVKKAREYVDSALKHLRDWESILGV